MDQLGYQHRPANTCSANSHQQLETGIFEFLEEQKGGYTFINKKYKNLLGKLDYYIRV